MNYDFFQSMNRERAQEYLGSFLSFGKEKSIEILEANTHFSLEIDFSIDSLSAVFVELLGGLKTVAKNDDPRLPEFIRRSVTYKKNLFEFDDGSKPIIIAAAYYLGETFIKHFDSLSWGTGNIKLYECNMPVVKGFRSRLELAPILVTENMFSSIISGMGTISDIEVTIKNWKNLTEG